MKKYYILRISGEGKSIAVPSEATKYVYTCEVKDSGQIIYTPTEPFKRV
jgi:hypothetical protein